MFAKLLHVPHVAGAMLAFALIVSGSMQLWLDVDGDGRPDSIRLVQQRAGVMVFVRYGDPRRAPQQFYFPADSSREDAVCSPAARLRVESQDYDPAQALGAPVRGFVRSKTAKGFQLVDGLCDSIHFFWNHKTQRLDWWRS